MNDDNNPHKITTSEWAQLSKVRAVQEAWGLDGGEDAELASLAYGARFDFMSGIPGYVGPLYVLFGDALSSPPLMIVREDGQLELVDFDT